ncbi:hypothetical protein CTheo_9185 [Ceratobasidium theobromae]|uniref:Uncharacterized protein n=1 Tax=Ceratobasidium theobromae TaxID=1582974 RepID=A0A5N5Q6B4_9AGAM|nr:hypothetical protein CTheo_9185 [Ceratobasidium theobromae]
MRPYLPPPARRSATLMVSRTSPGPRQRAGRRDREEARHDYPIPGFRCVHRSYPLGGEGVPTRGVEDTLARLQGQAP